MNEKFPELVSQLENAVNRLEEALVLEPTSINKDGSIQRFEFTIELAWKAIKTKAEEVGLEVNSPKESFRMAAQLGLIDDLELWFKFLKSRNFASHIYNEPLANEVYVVVRQFLPEVKKLLSKLMSSKP